VPLSIRHSHLKQFRFILYARGTQKKLLIFEQLLGIQ
jgi:hypothetical protein